MLSMCGLLCRMLRGWRHSEAVMLMAKALSQPQSSLLVQNIVDSNSSGAVTVNEPDTTSSFCQNSSEGIIGQMVWRDNNKQAVIVIPRQRVDLKRWTLFLATSSSPHNVKTKNAPLSTPESSSEANGGTTDYVGNVTILLEASYRDHDVDIDVDHHVMVEHLSQPYAWKARDTFGVIVTTTPPQLLAMIQAFFNNALLIDDDFLITKILTVDLIGEASSLDDPMSIPESVTPNPFNAERSGLTQLEIARGLSPTGFSVRQLPAIAAKDLEARSNSLHPPPLSNSLRHQSSENSTEDTSTTLHPQSSSDSDKHPSSLDPQSSYDSVSDYPTSDTDEAPCNVYNFYPRGWAISGSHVISGQPLSVRGVIGQLDGKQYKKPCSIVTNPMEDFLNDADDGGTNTRIKPSSCSMYSLRHSSCLNGPSTRPDDRTSLLQLNKNTADCLPRYRCISGAVFCRALQIEPGIAEREIVREAAEHYRRAMNSSSQERKSWAKRRSNGSSGEEEGAALSSQCSFTKSDSRERAVVTREPRRYPVRIRSEADLSRATSLIKDNLANIVENYLVKQSGSPDFHYHFPRLQMESPALKLPCAFSPSEQEIYMNGRVTEIQVRKQDQIVPVRDGNKEPSAVVPIVITEIKTPTQEELKNAVEFISQEIKDEEKEKDVDFSSTCDVMKDSQTPEEGHMKAFSPSERILPRISSDPEEPFVVRGNKFKLKIVDENLAGVHGVKPKESVCKTPGKPVKKLVKSEELALPTMKREGRIDIPVGLSMELDLHATHPELPQNNRVLFNVENRVPTAASHSPKNKDPTKAESPISVDINSQRNNKTTVDVNLENKENAPSDISNNKHEIVAASDIGNLVSILESKKPVCKSPGSSSLVREKESLESEEPPIEKDILISSEESFFGNNLLNGKAVVSCADISEETFTADVSELFTSAPKPCSVIPLDGKDGKVTSRELLKDSSIKESKKLMEGKSREHTFAGISIILEDKVTEAADEMRPCYLPLNESDSSDLPESNGKEGLEISEEDNGNGLEVRGSQRPRCLKDTHKLDTKSSTASESSFESLPYRMLSSQPESLTDDVVIELTRAPLDSERLRVAKQELMRLERMNAISMASQYLMESKDELSPEEKNVQGFGDQESEKMLEEAAQLDFQRLSHSMADDDDPNQDLFNSSLFDSGVEGMQSEQNSSGGSSVTKVLPSPVESTTESGFSSLKEPLPHEYLLPEEDRLSSHEGVSLSKSKDSLDLTDTDRFPGTDTLSDDMETLSSTAGDLTLVESCPVSKEGSARGSMSDSLSQEGGLIKMHSSEQAAAFLDSVNVPYNYQSTCDRHSKHKSLSVSQKNSLDASSPNVALPEVKSKVADDAEESSQSMASTSCDDRSKYFSDDGSSSKMKTSESLSSEDTVVSRISLEEQAGKMLRQGSQEEQCELPENQMQITPIEERESCHTEVTDASDGMTEKYEDIKTDSVDSSLDVPKSTTDKAGDDSFGISNQKLGESVAPLSQGLKQSVKSISEVSSPSTPSRKSSSFSILGQDSKRSSVADLIEMYDSKAEVNGKSSLSSTSSKLEYESAVESKDCIVESEEISGVKCDVEHLVNVTDSGPANGVKSDEEMEHRIVDASEPEITNGVKCIVEEEKIPSAEIHPEVCVDSPKIVESPAPVTNGSIKRRSDATKKSDVSDRSSPNNHETCSTGTSDRPSRHSSKSGVSDLEDEVFLPPSENYIFDGRPVIYCPKIDMAKQVKVEPPKMAMSVFAVVPSKELGSSKNKDWSDLSSLPTLPSMKDLYSQKEQMKTQSESQCQVLRNESQTQSQPLDNGEKHQEIVSLHRSAKMDLEQGLKELGEPRGGTPSVTDTTKKKFITEMERKSLSRGSSKRSQNSITSPEESMSEKEIGQVTVEAAKPVVKDGSLRKSSSLSSSGKEKDVDVEIHRRPSSASDTLPESVSLEETCSSSTLGSNDLEHVPKLESISAIPVVTPAKQPIVSPVLQSAVSPRSTYDPFTGDILHVPVDPEEDTTNISQKEPPPPVKPESTDQAKPKLSRVPNLERKDTDVHGSTDDMFVKKVEAKILDNVESVPRASPVISPVAELKRSKRQRHSISDAAALRDEKSRRSDNRKLYERKSESRGSIDYKNNDINVKSPLQYRRLEDEVMNGTDVGKSTNVIVKVDSKTSEESSSDRMHNQSSIESYESTLSSKSDTRRLSRGNLEQSVDSLKGWCVGGSLEFLEKHGMGAGRRSRKEGSITSAKSEDLSLKCDKASLKSQGSLDKFPHFDHVSAQQKARGARKKILSVDIDAGATGAKKESKEMHRSATLPVGSLASTKKEKEEKKKDKDEKSKKKKKEKEASGGGGGGSEKKSTMMSLKGLLKRSKPKDKDKDKEKDSSSQEKLSSPSLFRKFERKSKTNSQSPSLDEHKAEKGKHSDSSRPVEKVTTRPSAAVSSNGKARPVISSPMNVRQVSKPMDVGVTTTILRSSAAVGTSGSDSESPVGSLQSSPKRIISHPRKASLGNQPSPRLYRHVLTRHLSSSQESVDNPLLSSTHSSPQSSPHTSPKRKMPASASSYSLPASRDMSPPAPVMGTRALRGSSNSFSVTIGFKPTVEKRNRTMSEGADLNKAVMSPSKRKEGSRILTQLNKRSSSMEILVCGKIREHCSDGGKSPGGSPFSREGSFRLHREISVETLFELPETSPRSSRTQKDYQEYLEELHARNDSHHGSSCSLFEDSEADRHSEYYHRRSSHHSPAGKKLSLPHNMHLSGLREMATSNPNLQRTGSPFVRGMPHSSSFTSSPFRRPHSSAAVFSPAKRGMATNTGGLSPPEVPPVSQLMRVEEEGPCRKNIDSDTDKPPNVLVYASNKNDYFKAIRETLKYCLNQDRYTIYELTDEMAFKSPWSGSTTLLVVCGDVPAHISTAFIRYLLQGGRVLSICSDFLNMAVPLFGTVEVQEQAVVSVSYHQWSGVQLLHHQHCFHSSPQHKRFSREVDKPKALPNSRSAVSVEPTHVEITDEWGGRHRLDLAILATDDTWGAPSLLSAKVHGGRGKALFSQVHLERDPRECFGASEVSAKLSSSNEARLEILKELLSSELTMDTTQSNTVSLYTAAYFLGRHELKQELLNQLKPHMEGQELRRPQLTLQFVTSGESPRKPDEDVLPIYMNACPMTFSTVKYYEALNTTSIGRLLIYCDVLSSSMRVTAGHPSLVSGLVVVPTQQTLGKGRGGNTWLSPLGCTMFTIQLHVDLSSILGQYLSFIQHLIAIAMADAVRDQPGYEDIPVKLKWPNDIYIGAEMKIGGIIVEATTVGTVVIANIGCGINLSNSNPTYCINDAVRQHNEDNGTRLSEIEREVFLARTFNAFEQIISAFQKSGPQAVFPKYYKYWLHSNQTVVVQNETYKSESAVITGVDNYGFLEAQLISGELITLHPDGNSFDMMKGLIYSKYRH